MVMKKIRIHKFSDSIGLQLFERYYAYRQAVNAKYNYQSDVIIEYGPPIPDAVNIAFSSMPSIKFCNFDDYDLVLLDNAGESLEVSTPYIAKCLNKYKNVYLISGAFLDQTHWLDPKNIPFNHNIRLFHDVMVRGFYPQYYERSWTNSTHTYDICYINGQNRSNRQYFIELLQKNNVGIDIKSALTIGVAEVPDCQFEDLYDQAFREFANDCYDTRLHEDYYHSNSIRVGIDQQYGSVNLGYFIMNEYYDYKCVIFPETHWINNQHFTTEKIFKCFIAGATPWPIAGAKTHAMYNLSGYQTAWNLLPPEHQQFDNEYDHKLRYDKIILAIKWLKQNNHVLTSEMAYNITQKNYLKFFANTLDVTTVQKLHSVLTTIPKFNGNY
jgi:hypothetical protein